MRTAALNLTPADALVLLRLSGVGPADHSPLQPLLADADPADTSQSSLLERGLLVDDHDGLRTNLAVTLALATLAQPETTVELHFAVPDSERSIFIATTKGHSVGLRANTDAVELLFPIARQDLIRAIRDGMHAHTDTQISVDVEVSPLGQFLLGVFARHTTGHGAPLAELSLRTDDDILNPNRIASVASHQPGAIDRVFRNPTELQHEVAELVTAGAVIEKNRSYALTPDLNALLASEPIGSVSATRTDHTETPRSDSLTALTFANAILLAQPAQRHGEPAWRLSTVTDTQAADTIAALLFTQTELQALLQPEHTN